MKTLFLTLTMSFYFFSIASASQENKFCVKSEYDKNPNQVSCLNISKIGEKSFLLTAMNKAGWVLHEVRLTNFIENEKELLRFEVLPLDPQEPVKLWKIVNASSGRIIESTMDEKDENLKVQGKSIKILHEEYRVVAFKDMPTACTEAWIFCPLGAVASMTIFLAPIAIGGCADLLIKCDSALGSRK